MKLERDIKTIRSEQIRRIVRCIDNFILNSKKFNMADTILVAGTPRSGTTWLMEILGSLPKYTYLFEPLNPDFFPEAFKAGFQPKTYVPFNMDWLEGEDYLKKMFSGRITTHHSLALVALQSLFQFKPAVIMNRLLGNKLIIKSVRMNRLLPWVAKRFQLHDIIFIIRHPCAVIASQLKTGLYGYNLAPPLFIDTCPSLENILDEASKIEGLDYGLLNRLKRIKTQEEILAATWCLDHYVPLSFPKPHPWVTVIYEKFIKEREKDIIRLFNEIGEKNIPQAAIKHLNVASISALALWREAKVVKEVDEQLSKWKKFLSEKQIKRILNIVSAFGLDFYTEDLEPDYENIGIKV